jgi:hypothetical protein
VVVLYQLSIWITLPFTVLVKQFLFQSCVYLYLLLKENCAEIDDAPHNMAKDYEMLQVNLSAEYLLPDTTKKYIIEKKVLAKNK